MTLRTELVVVPGDIVFNLGAVLPHGNGLNSLLHFLARVYCGQAAGWIRIPLCTKVGLGPGDIVLDGVPACPSERGIAAPYFSVHINFGQMAG